MVEYKVMMLGPCRYVKVWMDNVKENSRRKSIIPTAFGTIPIMCLSLFLR